VCAPHGRPQGGGAQHARSEPPPGWAATACARAALRLQAAASASGNPAPPLLSWRGARWGHPIAAPTATLHTFCKPSPHRITSISDSALRSFRPRLTPPPPRTLLAPPAAAAPAPSGCCCCCCGSAPVEKPRATAASSASERGEGLLFVLAPPLVLARGARTRGGQGHRPCARAPPGAATCALSPPEPAGAVVPSPLGPPTPASGPPRELRRAALTAAQWTAASYAPGPDSVSSEPARPPRQRRKRSETRRAHGPAAAPLKYTLRANDECLPYNTCPSDPVATQASL
jgi:hypothetical protein